MFLYFTIAILLLVYFWFKKKFTFWERHGFLSVPGKIPFGSIGDFCFKFHTSDGFKGFYDKFKGKAPGIGFYFLSTPILLPIDTELIKDILVKNFESFQDHGFYHNFKDDPLTKNIFLTSGLTWKNMRVKTTPTFTSGKMKMMFDNVSRVCDGVIDYVKPTADDAGIAEMKEILASLTTEIIVSVAFGIDAKCIGDPTSEFRVIANKILNPPAWRAMRFPFMNSNQELARSLGMAINDKQTIKFFMEMIGKTIKYRFENNVTRNDYLQLLLQLKDTEGGMSNDEIVANCWMFFLAGHETSSSAATFALYELALNQEIQDRLRNEISEVASRHDGEITYDGIMEMKYLDMVFNETLRKFPVVDTQFRKCTTAFRIPNSNLIVPEGVAIMIPVHALHRDESFYDNPDQFDPERFTDENVKKRKPFTYLPFGEGPRICIGSRFGIMQTKLALVKLLQNFKFSPCDKTTIPMKFAVGSVFQTPVGGMWLKVENVK